MAPTRSLTRLLSKSNPGSNSPIFPAPPSPGISAQQQEQGSTIEMKNEDVESVCVTSSPQEIHSTAPRVPNVFVIPPEEEQLETPPWCFFDAAEDTQMCPPGPADTYMLDPSVETDYDTEQISRPIFKRLRPYEVDETVVMPEKRTRRQTILTIEALEEEAQRLEEKLQSMEVSAKAHTTEPSLVKKSKTIRSRALSAFKTMTFGRKGSRISGAGSPLTGGVVSQNGHDVKHVDSSYTTHTVMQDSQRKTRPLSQIFNFVESNRSVVDLDARRSFYASTSDNCCPEGALSHTMSAHDDEDPSFHPTTTPRNIICHPLERSLSSPPSARKAHRRFSMLGLRDRFSTSVKATLAETYSIPSTPSASMSSDVLSPSAAHETIMDEVSSSEASTPSSTDHFFVNEHISDIEEFFTPPQSPPLSEVKFSLDSLHFESLQFQSEDF